VDLSLPAPRVIRSLDQMIAWRGKPKVIRSDNGPEYLSESFKQWAKDTNTELRYATGKPATKCLRRALQQKGAIRMAKSISVDRHCAGASACNTLDVAIQS
jgi:transposase InsO family protein